MDIEHIVHETKSKKVGIKIYRLMKWNDAKGSAYIICITWPVSYNLWAKPQTRLTNNNWRQNV